MVEGVNLSEDTKQSLINTYIRPNNMISVEVVIVEPEFLRLVINSTVTYDVRKTTLKAGAIKNLVIDAIKQYREDHLIGFGTSLRYSNLVEDIDASDQSILGNLTDVKLKMRMYPTLGLPGRFVLYFNNAISKGDNFNSINSLNSSAFYIPGSDTKTYFGDNGRGSLYLYRYSGKTKVSIANNIGTIDYTNGKMIISTLTVAGLPGDIFYIDVVATPASYDITLKNNQIALLEDEDITVSIVTED
jgi:hypothetical protein